MSKKLIQRLAGLALILIVIASSFVAYNRNSQYSYNIPRMVGMENGETYAIDPSAPTDGIQGPFVETHDAALSLDVDLRDLPQVGPEEKIVAREMGQNPNKSAQDFADPVVQTAKTVGGRLIEGNSAIAPAPIKSFKGLNFASNGAGWPPDTHGDVGPTHYIQVVNTSIGIFRKSDGAKLSAVTFNSFFVAAGGSGKCATINRGDPVALHDHISGRWIITDFAFSGNGTVAPWYECIAVSKTANPVTGGWWLYQLTASTTALNDYPKLGVWNDGIYMSANMFTGGSFYGGVKVWALDRADLISGAPLTSVAFTLGTSYASLLPSNLEGTSAPAGTPNYFLSDCCSVNTMNMWKFDVNWASPGSSTFTGPTAFAVAPYSEPAWSSAVPQKNTSQKLDSLGDRLMTWLQYRNIGGVQSLWVSRTVKVGTRTGIRWYEIRGMSGAPFVRQQGSYAPTTTWRWMPSIAVDKKGNMAIVYSMSSAGLFPSIRYAGRLAGDPLGTLGQTERVLINGTGSQTGINRWGDYASISVDPSDGCTFWMTTEYYETTGSNWQTRIGAFKFPGCN